MEKIASFTIDHNNLFPGLYVSRVDGEVANTVTTFDMRFVAPNRQPALSGAVMHTVEHLAATYFRNSTIGDKIVYFGPMGCKTGFYLLTFGTWSSEQILPYVRACCEFILEFEGEIPGAKPEECGNWSYQDLDGAKRAVAAYLDELDTHARLAY